MRLFIAIEMPENVKDILVDIQKTIGDELAKTKWVSKEQMHLTLKFLGEVQEEKLPLIINNLKKIKFVPFILRLNDIGVFPSESYIRVIWIGVEPEKEIIELQSEVEDVLKEFKFKKDFKFHPHVTLGRVKFVKDKKGFVEKLKSVSMQKEKIEVKGFKLIKSILVVEGPVYEVLESFL